MFGWRLEWNGLEAAPLQGSWLVLKPHCCGTDPLPTLSHRCALKPLTGPHARLPLSSSDDCVIPNQLNLEMDADLFSYTFFSCRAVADFYNQVFPVMLGFTVESNLSLLCVMNGFPDYLQLEKMSLNACSTRCQRIIGGLICAWNMNSLSDKQPSFKPQVHRCKSEGYNWWIWFMYDHKELVTAAESSLCSCYWASLIWSKLRHVFCYYFGGAAYKPGQTVRWDCQAAYK